MAPGEVLSASARTFSQEVQSYHGTFHATASFQDSEMRMEGDFAFQAPDTMYMTMGFPGGTMEILLVQSDFYMHIPGAGWYVVTAETSGIDRDALQQYQEKRGVIDYADMVGQLDGLQQLPDVTRDGATYLHYRGTLDYGELMDNMPEDILDPSVLEQAQEFLGPGDVELWLEKETFLPYQVDVQMTFHVEDSSFNMDMSMKFTGYDEPITIPDVPRDAKPLDDLLGDSVLGPGRTLGLRCSYASKFLREKYDLLPGKGCVVLRVSSPGAAERAGFQIGDKIVQMDGEPITSGRQFTFLFEELPGTGQHGFVVQRGDQELTLHVDLADRAELPAHDPYFYYLRAKSDTEGADIPQIIADYSSAIQLEPEFDLAYLYRGIANVGRDDEAATADLLKALGLDPELTEAYRALAQIAQDQEDIPEALELINRTIALNGCGPRLERWDIDCAEDLAVQNDCYFDRMEPGDDVFIQANADAVEDVIFFEGWVVFSRFRLAYMRGHDGAAIEFGREFLSTPLNRLTSYLEDSKAGIRYMLDTGSCIPSYSCGGWGQGTLVEAQFAGSGPGEGFPFVIGVTEPQVSRGETVSWELWRGPYRFASAEAQNAWGDDWVVDFRHNEDALPGRYELKVYVDCQPVGSNSADLP